MRSLRGRLFAILLAATGVIWLTAVVWIYAGTRAELEHVLDTRLREAARMVNSLVASGDLTASAAATAAGTSSGTPISYERQLSCQIWSLDGKLIARSGGAPDERLTDYGSGFSDRTVGGEPWRVYSIEDRSTGIRVLVGDRLGLRDRLVGDLIKGLIAPVILIVPALALLIWGSLGRGLRPLVTMASDLRSRSADDMRPVDTGAAPREVRPLADAINGLFEKVAAARRHERDVTAFAAHELRTPLAGLKTQAQIALATDKDDVRKGALQHIVTSVDRTSRLVRQLLALARLDAGDAPAQAQDVNLGALVAEIADPGPAGTSRVRVEIAPSLDTRTVRTDREILAVCLRNLHENALAHSPEGGTVRWQLRSDGTVLAVTDEGPGIPEDELPLVAQRFFRGRHKDRSGTGLGLAIVATGLARIGAGLDLRNRTDRTGLEACVTLSETTSV